MLITESNHRCSLDGIQGGGVSVGTMGLVLTELQIKNNNILKIGVNLSFNFLFYFRLRVVELFYIYIIIKNLCRTI